MSFIRINFVFLICSLIFSTQSLAQERATPADAEAWVKKAVAFLKTAGKEKALVEFNNSKGRFVKRDLYIFVINSEGTTLANGVNARLVGENIEDITDKGGKHFVREMLKMSLKKQSGWIEYQWFDPSAQKVRPKTTYFEKVDNMLICSGAYK